MNPEHAQVLIARAEKDCGAIFAQIDANEERNTQKVLRAFRRHEIAARHFAPTTGYGYDDIGRTALEALFCDVLGCEAALVRPQIASGTHALAIALYGILRPGDALIAGAGKPYDTLEEVIGLSGERGNGSLRDFGVSYRQVELKDGKLDIPGILEALGSDGKLVLLQRSRGYDWRSSLSVAEINEAVQAIHHKKADVVVMVDNCYGEFTHCEEPQADVLVGSLIKNPGGGLAPTGGYVAGRADCVEKITYRYTSPGVGGEIGSYAGGYQPFFQGLFLAPHTVAQALKTAVLAARALEMAGYEVSPAYDAPRNDIIQAIKFGAAEPLIAFCQAIQAHSPVDSFVVPEPWAMPGYQDQVIMAAGTFVSGASIELSADAPIRAPYIAYLQGGLTYAHGKLALMGALEAMP